MKIVPNHSFTGIFQGSDQEGWQATAMGNGEAWSNRSKDGRLTFPRLLDKKVRTKEMEKTAIFRTPERKGQSRGSVCFVLKENHLLFFP
jgi:uridine phosphorylase